MKNIFLSLVCAVVFTTIFTSCESSIYEESFYLKGDRVEVIEGETVIIRDTVYVEKIIEIETEKAIDFACYDFTRSGNIEGHASNHAVIKEFSYNFFMDVEKNVFFNEQESASFEVSPNRAIFEKSVAHFYVGNGVEQKSVVISVPGSNSVIINSKEIYPCNPFSVTAEMGASQSRTIDGREYEVAEVTYTFFNGEGDVVRSAKQTLYSPIKAKEPVNERTVTINHRVENNNLVIEGHIDNTLWADTTAVVNVPLKLTLKCDDKKTVYGNNLNSFSYDTLREASKTISKNGLTASAEGISVTYNEYESTYSQNVTASGNVVEVKHKVVHYNDFTADFYGEKYTVSLPLDIVVVNNTSGEQTVVDGKVSLMHTINYRASVASLNVTDNQDVEVIISAISFDGQRVEEAYRTITFSDHSTPLVYDCVLARTINGSDHYFYYREIVNDKPQAWVSTKLTTSEYNAILAGKAKAADKGNKFALTIYYHKNHGMRLGYLIDGCPTEVIYYALTEGLPSVTLMGSRFVFLGDLNTAIAGASIKEGDLIKLYNTNDIVYNGKVIASGEDIYFY
jgi:hypothetical protein